MDEKEEVVEVQKRGMQKREKALVRVAEAFGTTLDCDIMTLDELADFPDIGHESLRNQGIMAMSVVGHGTPSIARAFGIKQPTVFNIIKRIDPTGIFKHSPDAKKAYATKIAESRMVEAISSITPEKLADCSAVDGMRVAKGCSDLIQNMNQSKHKEIGSSKMDMLMDALERESAKDVIPGKAPYETNEGE